MGIITHRPRRSGEKEGIMKRLQAVAAAVAACPAEERPWLVDRLWANGFFGRDPFLWAEKSKAVGLDLSEVMLGRHRLVTGQARV